MTQLVGGSDKAVWFTVLVNLLTVALSAPLGQTSDYWGRRWVLILLSACGFVGSIIISRGTNISSLIAGSAIMSINFGGLCLLYAITSEVLPRKYRALGQAFQQLVSSSATIAALMFGTALVNDNHPENFRIYWYLTAGLFGASIVGLYFGYKPPPRILELTLTRSQKIRKLDWIGILLFIPGLTLFGIALAWTDNPYSWTSVNILVPFVLSILLLIAFGIYEWRFRDDGIFHHQLITRNFLISCLIAFDEGLAFFTANSYLVLETQLYHNRGPLAGSYPYLVLICAAVAAVSLMGFLSTRFRTVKIPAIVGIGLLLVFNSCMATLKPTHSIARMMGFAAIGGAGDGVILPAILTVSQLSTPPELISLTSAMIMTLRSVGGTVGPVVNSALYSNALSRNLFPKVSAAVLAMGFPKRSLDAFVAALIQNDYDSMHALGATDEMIAAASASMVDAYSIAFRNMWIAAAACASLGWICEFPLTESWCVFSQESAPDKRTASFFLVGQASEFNARVDATVEQDASNQGGGKLETGIRDEQSTRDERD